MRKITTITTSSILLAALGCATLHSRNNDPVTIGAIRWDAWHTPVAAQEHGAKGGPVRAMEMSLNPHRYRWRAPFFALVDTNDILRIDGYTQEIIDQEIAYAKAGGIDYWAFLLYPEDNSMSQGLSLYLNSKSRSKINFCAVASPTTFGSRATWQAGIERIIKYMREPGYQSVCGGRPLLYLFRPDEKWIRAWGGSEGARELFNKLRSAAVAADVGDPYIVVMHQGAANVGSKAVEAVGAQALTDYARSGGGRGASYAELTKRLWDFWSECAATSVDVVPLAMAGWDRRPRVEHPVPWEPWQKPGVGLDKFYMLPTPKELAAHLDEAMTWTEKNTEICPAQTVIVYAWNEHDEGGWLCPTIGRGGVPDASRLEAIAAMRKIRVKQRRK